MKRSGASGLRAVFAVPGYRRLWAARTASQWGDVAATVALGLLGAILLLAAAALAPLAKTTTVAPTIGRDSAP